MDANIPDHCPSFDAPALDERTAQIYTAALDNARNALRGAADAIGTPKKEMALTALIRATEALAQRHSQGHRLTPATIELVCGSLLITAMRSTKGPGAPADARSLLIRCAEHFLPQDAPALAASADLAQERAALLAESSTS